MQETVQFLQSFLKENDRVILGLSGGPDSMCLLDILVKLSINLEIVCVHVNHNIRDESDDEALFVSKYCNDCGIKFETVKFDKKSTKKDYSEQELREKRYSFFEKMVNKYKAHYLFTAHHGDDLVETILMRLTRGSNLKGYSGIQLVSDKDRYKIVRPLLFVTKEDIENYNNRNNIPVVIDKSNLSDKYTRNRYRHTVLPFLKKENKMVHLKYLKFSQELFQYYNYVDKIVNEHLANVYKNGILYINDFLLLDELLKRKIIETILDEIYIDNLYLVNDNHVSHILSVIENSKPNISINLPNNLKIVKSYNQLIFNFNGKSYNNYNIELKGKTMLPNGHYIEMKKNSDITSNYCIRLNSDELKLPLYVRNRCDGDRMFIKNMNHARKLKDIYIDCKLPLASRKAQPVVVDSNNNVIWLPGLKKSKFDKAKKQKYDIILWYN